MKHEKSGVNAQPADAALRPEELAVDVPPDSPFVGEVVDSRHPTLAGRALVAWSAASGARRERWLPCIHGLAIRNSDRVLVTQPSNWAEAIVTGVIDGFCKRPDVQRSGPSLALLPDEHLRVTDASGAPLVDVVPSDQGPVVRILRADVNIEVEGKLRLAAQEIDIVSRDGDARVDARENVVILGRTIQLN